jgi:putative MATE family efflux protein
MKKKFDLTKGNIIQDLLLVALPTLGTSLIQMAYNLTDMFWVSKVDTMGLVPEEAVGAVGTIGFFPWFGFGLILLAKIGTSVRVSQAAGRDDMEQVETIGNNGLILMLFFGLLYSLFGIFGNRFYVGLFNIENDTMVTYAHEYMRIIGYFGMAFFTVNLFNGVYDGLGKTINTLMVTASGLILNMILDPIFILEEVNVLGLFTIQGLGMGVQGAAWATGIGQSSIVITYIVIYTSKWRPFTISLFKQFDVSMIKQIVRIGFFVGLQSMLFTMISMYIATLIVQYGEAPLAIQRIGSQIESVAWMIASGFQVALASFVGQNFGAEKYDRIKDGYKQAMKILVPYGIFVNIMLFVFAEDLFRIFFDDPATLAIGKTYLEILSFSQLFMIVELGTAGVFNGLGRTEYPMGVGIVGNVLRIPGALLLSVSLGYAGIWWAVSFSSILKGTILVIWLIYFLRRLGVKGGIAFDNSDQLVYNERGSDEI